MGLNLDGHWYRRTATALVGLAAVVTSAFPQGVHADTTHSHLVVHATISNFTLNPNLNLTFAADKSAAIPGDTLTYSGAVTHAGVTACLPGTFSAQNIGGATATIADFSDEWDTWDPNRQIWVPLVGVAYTQQTFIPVVTPAISTGITITVTTVPASGVTYPAAGSNPIIGTQIAPGATAVWSGSACITLTAAQLQQLASATQVRERSHFEDTPGDTGEAWTDDEHCPSPFNFLPYLAAKNVVVTVTPPSGSAVQIPVTSSLAVGATAPYSTTYKVPVPSIRGSGESEAAYVQRLTNLEGSSLTAKASVTATGPTGPVSATAPSVTTTEHLPILSISKSGPGTSPAGQTEVNPLTLQNNGGATASGIAINDAVPSGTAATVTGIPTSIAPGATSTSAQANYPVPISQSSGPLTDTATITWQDANGNAYGSLSSQFTTQALAAQKLKLTGSPGPNPTGATETVTVTVVDYQNQPLPNINVVLNITGANAQQSTVVSGATGIATFSYIGANAGTDTVQASTSTGAQSNTVSVSWITPIQKVTTTLVQGNFYAEPSNPQTFAVTAQSVPDFGQAFPTINFNPPAGTIPHSPPGTPTDQTRPFTDVTTDVNGNFSGTIVAQGNNLQAGMGNLANFDAVFTSNLLIAQAGDVTFNFNVDDGFMIGVGNSATRVSGAYENAPAANTSAINGYPLMGAWNQPGSGVRTVTIHFPAPGTYPYEIDYFEANGAGLSLTMSVAQFNPQTNPLSIYVGYADGLRAAGSIFPYPWLGSPGVNFIGCCPAFDAGAVRFDNSSSNAIVLDSVTVDIGGNHFDLWGRNLTVPANQILMLSQTSQYNFDTSDYSGSPCGINNGVIPTVHVTIAGVTTTYNDSNQILNTRGFDLACQGNESESWQRIGGGGNTINVPLPPATTLALTPAVVSGRTVGQTQTFTVAAMDATGQPVANLPVTLAVNGANGPGGVGGALHINGTTDSAGIARMSYVGMNAGTDTAQVTAFVMGLQTLSNSVSVPWSLAPTANGTGTAPAPAITSPSPADGTTITKPVPIAASFSPPAGQTIASWSVSYQDQAPGSAAVTIASGTGTPPATLGTLDPTLLPNSTYTLTISATASGGGVQTLTSSVTVSGNLKLGRYVTTYQDLSVPAGGVAMEVRRVYDSTDKRSGDFGVGWHVQLANYRVTTNRTLGLGGLTQFNSYCAFGLCLTSFKSSVPHYVTVTYPDGHQEIFDFTPTGGSNVFGGGSAAFTGRQGTTSTLQALGDTSLTYLYDGNLYGSDGIPYNPVRFKLTTLDGRVLVLDIHSGLVSQTDRNGNSLTIDAAGVHASNGQSILYTRDASGRITQISGPTGQVLHYAYSAAGDLATSTDPDGNTITYSYDSNHDLLSDTGPGATQPFEQDQYDATGRLVAITDGNGHTTHLSTNVGAQQQVITDPLGQVTSVLTLDDQGDLLQRDEVFSGRTVTDHWTYDSLGRVLSHTDALGHAVATAYDASGNLTQFTDASGNTFKYTYNAFGQRTSSIGPDGTVLDTRTYDANGNLVQVQQVGGATIGYAYDANGNLTQATNGLNQATSLAYDANGHLAKITDPAGHATIFTTDASGHVLSVADPAGGTTSYGYDANGNLTTVTTPSTGTWTAQYDFRGNVLSVKDPLGGTKSFVYDAAFQPVQVTDRNGQVTTYAYDANEQMTKKTLPGGDVTTFSFDPLGRMIDTSNSSADIKMTYDDGGRLTSQTTTGTGSAQPAVTLTYAYDAKGNRTSMTGPDGTTSYSYTPYSELASLTDPSGGHYGFTYNAALQLTGMTRPNGVADSLSFDATGNLTSRSSTGSAGPITSASYALDNTGHRISATDASGTTSFTHDAAGQLTGVTPPGGTGAESFIYDAAGNRTSATGIPATSVHYDAANHLLTYGPTSYTYDAEGNLTKKTDASGTTSYTWNADHRLVSIQNPDLTTTTYRYDPLGRRIEVQSAAQDTRYAYDGTNIHLEYDGTNTLQASYTDGSGTDSVLAMRRGGSQYYYSVDGLNSTTALTDSTGSVVQRYSYDAFGQPTATGSVANPFTFTGRQQDSSGLYYMRARYYDPATGRFVSEDPRAAANLYPYGANDPVDFNDPSGAQAFVEEAKLGALTGALYSALSQGLVQVIAYAFYHCSPNVGAFLQAVVLGAITGGVFGAAAPASYPWLFRALFGGMLGLAVAGIQIAIDGASGKPDTPQQQIEIAASGFLFGALGGATSNVDVFGRNRPPTAGETTFLRALEGSMRTGAAGFADSQLPGDLLGTFIKGAAGC